LSRAATAWNFSTLMRALAAARGSRSPTAARILGLGSRRGAAAAADGGTTGAAAAMGDGNGREQWVGAAGGGVRGRSMSRRVIRCAGETDVAGWPRARSLKGPMHGLVPAAASSQA
jgi:hypothetical protein